MPPTNFDPIALPTFLMMMFPAWLVASVALIAYCKDKLTWSTGNGNSKF